MAALDITIAVVGEPGPLGDGQLLSPNSAKTTKDADLGARLREERRLLHLSIAQVAAAAAISAAQLSRIERGQARRSRLITWCGQDPVLRGDERRRVFINPILDDLVAGICRPSTLNRRSATASAVLPSGRIVIMGAARPKPRDCLLAQIGGISDWPLSEVDHAKADARSGGRAGGLDACR